MYRGKTDRRSTKKSGGDNGTKSPKQNAKSPGWSTDCGSKKYKLLLEEQNMLSVNQMAAQIKLTEMWKASNDPQYPIKMKIRENQEEGMGTRSVTPGYLTERGGLAQAKKSFTIDAAKVWNKAP